MQVEKTVFICYRRTNVFHARAIQLALTHRGYDVFLDFESIDSGAFERVILNQIAARAHFLIILTSSTLERCVDADDWVRREIERAVEMKRNIVPLMFETFEFRHAQEALTGPLALLPQYNGLRVPQDYFEEAIDRLCARFLNTPLDMVLHPTSPAEQAIVAQQQARATAAPAPDPTQLSAEQYFEAGLSHRKNGDLEQAIAAYTEAIRLKPDYAYAYFNRGLARRQQDDLDGAIADYNAAARLDPMDAEVYNNRGVAYYLQDDFDSAQANFNEAIRLNPNYIKAYYNRAIAHRDANRLREAIADYEKYLELGGGLDDGDQETVEERIRELRAKLASPASLSAEHYVNSGLAHRQNGELEQAIADYTEAIRLKPDYAQAYYNRGLARRQQDDLDGAIADYNAAARLNPADAEIYNNRGVAYYRRDDLDHALDDYNHALRLDPDYINAYYNRAMVNRDANHLREAIADYEKYLELGGGLRDGDQETVEGRIRELRAKLASQVPNSGSLSAEHYFNSGLAHRKTGELEQAIADYTEAIRLKPDYTYAYFNRGFARKQQGDLAGAIADYTEAARLDPTDADTYNNRGLARKQQGDLAGAIDDYTTAIRLNPQESDSYNNRGAARKAQGDTAGALDDYNAAIRLNPRHIDAHYNRAIAHRALNRLRDAIADYEKYLELGGGIRDGDQAEVEQRIRDLRAKL